MGTASSVSEDDKINVSEFVRNIDIDFYINNFKKQMFTTPVTSINETYIINHINLKELSDHISKTPYMDVNMYINEKMKIVYSRIDRYIYNFYSFIDDFEANISLFTDITDKYTVNKECNKKKLEIASYCGNVFFRYGSEGEYEFLYPIDNQSIESVSSTFLDTISNVIKDISNSDCDLVTIQLILSSLDPESRGGHANLIIVEKYLNELVVSHYEPHGKSDDSSMFDIDVDIAVEIIYYIIKTQKSDDNFIVKMASKSCSRVGIQSFTSSFDTGYCQIFSLLWLDLNLYIRREIVRCIRKKFPTLPITSINVDDIMGEGIEERFIKTFSSPQIAYDHVVSYCYTLITKYITDVDKLRQMTNIVNTDAKENVDKDDIIQVTKSVTYREVIKFIDLYRTDSYEKLYSSVDEYRNRLYLGEESDKPELSDTEIKEQSYEKYVDDNIAKAKLEESNTDLLGVGKLCTNSGECASNCCKESQGDIEKKCQYKQYCFSEEQEYDIGDDDDFLDIIDYRVDDQLREIKNAVTAGDLDEEIIID